MSKTRQLISEAGPDWTLRDKPPDVGPYISWLAGIINVESPGTKIDWVTIGAFQDEEAAVEFIRSAESAYPSRVIDSYYGTVAFNATINRAINPAAARDRLREVVRRLKPSRVVILVETLWSSDGMVIITDDSVEKIQRKLTAAKTMEESVSGWQLIKQDVTRAILEPKRRLSTENARDVAVGLVMRAAPMARIHEIRTPDVNSDNFDALLGAGYKSSAVFCSSTDAEQIVHDATYEEDLHRRFCAAVSRVGQDVSHAYIIQWEHAKFAMTVLFTNDSFDKLMRKIAAASAMTEHLSAGN